MQLNTVEVNVNINFFELTNVQGRKNYMYSHILVAVIMCGGQGNKHLGVLSLHQWH